MNMTSIKQALGLVPKKQCNHCKEQFESLVTMKLNDWASAEVCEKCCQEYRALEARFSAWKDINNK